MSTLINLLRSPIALSRARSLLVYQPRLWLRHNLKVSLRRNMLAHVFSSFAVRLRALGLARDDC